MKKFDAEYPVEKEIFEANRGWKWLNYPWPDKNGVKYHNGIDYYKKDKSQIKIINILDGNVVAYCDEVKWGWHVFVESDYKGKDFLKERMGIDDIYDGKIVFIYMHIKSENDFSQSIKDLIQKNKIPRFNKPKPKKNYEIKAGDPIGMSGHFVIHHLHLSCWFGDYGSIPSQGLGSMTLNQKNNLLTDKNYKYINPHPFVSYLINEKVGFCLPINKGKKYDLTDDQINEAHALSETSNESNFFPITTQGLWHNGIHLKGNEKSYINSMLDGIIKYVKINKKQDKAFGSSNFVLIKHDDFHVGVNKVVFYSLYMHLQPISIKYRLSEENFTPDWIKQTFYDERLALEDKCIIDGDKYFITIYSDKSNITKETSITNIYSGDEFEIIESYTDEKKLKIKVDIKKLSQSSIEKLKIKQLMVSDNDTIYYIPKDTDIKHEEIEGYIEHTEKIKIIDDTKGEVNYPKFLTIYQKLDDKEEDSSKLLKDSMTNIYSGDEFIIIEPPEKALPNLKKSKKQEALENIVKVRIDYKNLKQKSIDKLISKGFNDDIQKQGYIEGYIQYTATVLNTNKFKLQSDYVEVNENATGKISYEYERWVTLYHDKERAKSLTNLPCNFEFRFIEQSGKMIKIDFSENDLSERRVKTFKENYKKKFQKDYEKEKLEGWIQFSSAVIDEDCITIKKEIFEKPYATKDIHVNSGEIIGLMGNGVEKININSDKNDQKSNNKLLHFEIFSRESDNNGKNIYEFLDSLPDNYVFIEDKDSDILANPTTEKKGVLKQLSEHLEALKTNKEKVLKENEIKQIILDNKETFRDYVVKHISTWQAIGDKLSNQSVKINTESLKEQFQLFDDDTIIKNSECLFFYNPIRFIDYIHEMLTYGTSKNKKQGHHKKESVLLKKDNSAIIYQDDINNGAKLISADVTPKTGKVGDKFTFIAKTDKKVSRVCVKFDDNDNWVITLKPETGKKEKFLYVLERIIEKAGENGTKRRIKFFIPESGDDENNKKFESEIDIAEQKEKVKILNADITEDCIEILLEPKNVQGTLKIELISSTSNHIICSGQKTGGDYQESFNIDALSTGEFSQVRAIWKVGNIETQDTFHYHIHVLGIYRHSQYNVPSEAECENVPEKAYITNSSCNFTATKLRSQFIDKVNLNGSGLSINHGKVKREFYCLNRKKFPNAPKDAGGITFRSFAGDFRGFWGELNDFTVAVNPNHPFLTGNDRVYIHNHGVKVVTDKCPGCTIDQLDNFTTNQSCSGIVDLGNYMTIKLFEN